MLRFVGHRVMKKPEDCPGGYGEAVGRRRDAVRSAGQWLTYLPLVPFQLFAAKFSPPHLRPLPLEGGEGGVGGSPAMLAHQVGTALAGTLCH